MKKKTCRQILYCIFLAVLILMGLFLKKKSDRTQAVNSQSVLAVQAEELPPRVALTCDDGPHRIYTRNLLDGLRERGVKATFFVVGENIPGNEDLIRQMEEDGHLIGNHTYDHADISKMSDEENCRELRKTSELVKQITGHQTAYVRPPFGNWKESMDCRISMISVKWTIDTLDWKSKNVEEIIRKVMQQVSDHDIILMHDIHSSTVDAALQLIPKLIENGYQLVTVSEMAEARDIILENGKVYTDFNK